MELLGMKLHPTNHGWREYQSFAFSIDQRGEVFIALPLYSNQNGYSVEFVWGHLGLHHNKVVHEVEGE
jgi:hypothetical protein